MDTAELAKGGAQATTLADTLDALSEEVLLVSIGLALKLAANLDAELGKALPSPIPLF